MRGYYDYALAASFGAARWVVADVSTVPWYEVDDPGDRLQAEYVFGTPASGGRCSAGCTARTGASGCATTSCCATCTSRRSG